MSTIIAILNATSLGQALPAHPTVAQNVWFQLAGLGTVLLSLSALYGLCALSGLAFSRREAHLAARKAAPGRPVTELAATSAPVPDSGSRQREALVPIAVIAAATAAVLTRRHRILEIRPVILPWSLEGRRAITTSHQLARR